LVAPMDDVGWLYTMRLENYARFPAHTFRSADEFKRFQLANGDVLDERYRRETALGTKGGAIVLDGSCGLCLRVTSYNSESAGGEMTSDGRIVPSWREQQTCGCEWGLNSRERAMLHFAAPRLGAPDWYRAAVFGQDQAVVHFLTKMVPNLAVWPRLAGGALEEELHLPAATSSFHMVASADYLQFVPSLDTALAEVARTLVPGGIFVFTIPFHHDVDMTKSDVGRFPRRTGRPPAVSADPVHHFGWDILARLREARFSDCTVHCYWSEELGYLGTYNMIFVAVR
jgi:SAM-dependent methyltransferase